jgi:outer membrane murein-binding lipoprotein Lpp
MTCAKKALMVLTVTTLAGLWGCTQSNPPNSASARLRELEAKTARLEDDVKTALAARDQARKKAALLEEQRTQLAQQVDQLDHITREREELKQQVTARTAERDAVQTQLLQFGRDLQTLATKIEQTASANFATPPPPVSAPPPSTVPVTPPAQSE